MARAGQTPYLIIAIIVVLSIALAGAVGWLSVTRARGGPAPSAAKLAARGARDHAFEHLRAQRYPEAIAALELGHQSVPHPHFLLDIALAYHAWGDRCGEALDAAQRFLAACPACPGRTTAAAELADLHARCAGEVMIDSTPVGATITVGGRPYGTTPAVLHLPLGAHPVVLTLEGHPPHTAEVTAARDTRNSFTFALTSTRADAEAP